MGDAVVVGTAPGLARPRGRRSSLVGWTFLLPVIALNLVVIIGPAVASIYYSLTEWSGLGAAEFVGLGNYGRLLQDANFHKAFVNNVQWTVMNLTLPVGFGLVGAALLSRARRFSMVYRVVFFIPYVIASVVNVNIWRQIYHPLKGVGPYLAQLTGLEWLNVKPLGDPDLVLYAVYFTNFWHWWGFLLVLYLAAMQAIDADLYDAAAVEGASGSQQFRFVTIPGILPTLMYSLLQTIIWSFLSFDYVFLMTEGGPGNASLLLAVYAYQNAFADFRVGYAAAIGMSLSFVAALVTLLFVMLRRRGWEV
jgi:raffinose/stachyose/melibiose transport system permease protein